MLSGVVLKEHQKEVESYLKGKSGLFITISVACLAGHVIMRFLTMMIPPLMKFQFAVQVFTWGFAVAFFLYMWSIENQLKKYFTERVFRLVADSTLEIYLVNMMVINRMNAISGMLGAPIAFILIFIIGCCVHIITSKIINCVYGIYNKMH